MSSLINNKFIEEINPKALSGYLESKGWIKDGNVFEHAFIWHRKEPESYDFEVIQPLSTDIKAYKQRVYDALNALAEYEERTVQIIAVDIINFYSDLVKVRVVHDDVEGGSIPIDDGVLLVEKARDLLLASTLSTFKKKRHFSGQRSKDVQDYLNQLRLGQTEVGSFIVNLIAPIQFYDSSQIDEEHVSFTRSVTNNLSRSLQALSNSIDRYEKSSNVFDFEEVIDKGVSANLCDALCGLSGSNKTRSFNITIALAGSESDNQELPKKFSFKPSTVPFLEIASSYYKGKYTIKDYEVYGLVSKMKHLPDDEYGEITVKSLVRGVDKNVVIQLPLENYWQAVHAHECSHLVSCKGVLNVTPRSARLLDEFDFRTIDNTEYLTEQT